MGSGRELGLRGVRACRPVLYSAWGDKAASCHPGVFQFQFNHSFAVFCPLFWGVVGSRLKHTHTCTHTHAHTHQNFQIKLLEVACPLPVPRMPRSFLHCPLLLSFSPVWDIKAPDYLLHKDPHFFIHRIFFLSFLFFLVLRSAIESTLTEILGFLQQLWEFPANCLVLWRINSLWQCHLWEKQSQGGGSYQ